MIYYDCNSLGPILCTQCYGLGEHSICSKVLPGLLFSKKLYNVYKCVPCRGTGKFKVVGSIFKPTTLETTTEYEWILQYNGHWYYELDGWLCLLYLGYKFEEGDWELIKQDA